MTMAPLLPSTPALHRALPHRGSAEGAVSRPDLEVALADGWTSARLEAGGCGASARAPSDTAPLTLALLLALMVAVRARRRSL